MASKMKQASLIFVGLVAGVLISLNFQAIADRASRSPLPVYYLMAFTELFGAIKANYVETVEDKKLITEAINGMLSGLDPHSAYLDAEAFRELQVGTQGVGRATTNAVVASSVAVIVVDLIVTQFLITLFY